MLSSFLSLFLIYFYCFTYSFFFFNDTATTEIYTLSLHDALPIFVVNREVRRVADVPDVLAEDPHARRVEGRDQRRSDPDGRQQLLHPPRHLARGLVGERDGEDVPRMHTAHAEEPRDPVGDDARLAAAGAREHEDRPVVRRDGVALRRIQLGEKRVAVQHQPIVP